jgi:hypothetical protein
MVNDSIRDKNTPVKTCYREAAAKLSQFSLAKECNALSIQIRRIQVLQQFWNQPSILRAEVYKKVVGR